MLALETRPPETCANRIGGSSHSKIIRHPNNNTAVDANQSLVLTESPRDIALAMAEMGVAIFPCCPSTKKPLTRNGLHDATSNARQIAEWWSKHPNAMIGRQTGKGVFVVDTDPPDGADNLEKLERKHGKLPKTLCVESPRTGKHRYFTTPGPVKNSAGKIGKNIDIRGDGGYVIAPGSINAEGKKYLIVDQSPVAEAPHWLVDLANKTKQTEPPPKHINQGKTSRYGKKALEKEIESIRTSSNGTRNDSFNRAAFSIGQLVAGGEIDEGEAFSMIEAALSSGLEDTETIKTFKSGFEAGKSCPRQAPEKRTAGDIIKQLSDLKANGEDITIDVWGNILKSARLSANEEGEVIDYLSSQGIGKKRSLTHEYQRLSKEADAEAKWEELQKIAGHRHLVENIPHDINQTTQRTEEAVIEVRGRLPYFDYGGALSYATYEQPLRRAVGVDNEQPPKIPLVKQYSIDSLHLRVEQSALHYEQRTDKEGINIPYPISTPQSVLHKMLDNPFSLAPKVSGLVSHPVLSLEGRVIDKEGIDEETGLLLQFGGSYFRAPGRVTRENARNACEHLSDTLFPEFDYRNEDESPDLYRTAAIAFLLTGIFRKVIDQGPGISIIASTQGTGKTTLARIVHVLLTGRDMPVSSLSGTPEEMQKSMLATMLQSPAMICFDNILDGSEVRDPILAKVITSPYFKGRVLGKSQEVTVPTNSLIVLTGNNITLCADLVRRFLPIHLTANMAQPEARNFKNPDIVQHCLNSRARAIESCLTIVKAYLDAGCPLQSETLGSSGFHQWDRMVRFPLLWATGVDVLEAINLNRVHSTEHHAMRGVLDGLYQIFMDRPFSATDLMRKLDSPSGDETVDYLRECVVNLAPRALDSTRSLSWVLKKLVERIIDGKLLKYRANSSGNMGKYHVTKSVI